MYEYLLCHKEVIGMYAQIAVVVAVFFSAWAICTGAKAIKLQRNAIQTGLFADFYKTALEIKLREDEFARANKVGEWCVLFLGHLEYLACLVNKEHISMDLAKSYRGIIIDWHDDVLVGQKEKLKEYYKDHPQTFSELEILYQKLKEQSD